MILMSLYLARSGCVAWLLVSILFAASGRAEGTADLLISGEHDRSKVLQSPHPYPGTPDGRPRIVWSESYAHAGASYIVVEFKKLDLAEGDWLEVRDPEGRQVHAYRGLGYKDKGGDFISKMVLGPEVRIDLYSVNPKPKAYGYRIERVSWGYPSAMLESLPAPESVCGPDDRQDAACYSSAYPAEYQRARGVARLVMDGVALCTAWIASCENHLLTNAHCTWDADQLFDSQEELDRMEVQFMAEAPCGGGTVLPASAFLGGTWLESDRSLDYSLFLAPTGEDPAGAFGHLVLDTREPVPDEPIYLPGHPAGGGKKIAITSSHPQDQSGFCEIAGVDEAPCIGGATVPETGYHCDTEGGSSGSPILSRISQKVLALHHCGGCPNRAVPITAILARIQSGTHPLPSCSTTAIVALDRTAYTCAGTVRVTVRDEGLWSQGAVAISAASTSETEPDSISLPAVPPASGRFSGDLPLTTDPALAGDGRLSTAPGDLLTIDYLDAGGTVRSVSAAVDCVGPVISAVSVTGVTHSGAVVGWNTDEPAVGGALYGFPGPPTSYKREASGLRVLHKVVLDGLEPCSSYRAAVRAEDAAGNAAVDSAGGLYYGFTTLGADYALAPEGAETAGVWTVTGTSGSQWHPDACDPYFGAMSWRAGADATQPCTAPYAPGSLSDLVSPVFALGPSGHGHHLRWVERYDTEADPSCSYDPARVQISLDAGATWADLLTPYCGASGGWGARDIDLGAYAGDAVQVRFRFSSDGLGQRFGWHVDGIEVGRAVACSPPAPVADGSATAPGIRVTKASGSDLLVLDYATPCAPGDLNLLWGPLSGLPAYQLAGAECGLPPSAETTTWAVGSSTDLWFVLVGGNGMGMESSWGTDSAGAERGGPVASGYCGAQIKNLSAYCP